MHLLQEKEMVYIPSVFTISNVWNKKSIQERFICISHCAQLSAGLSFTL